MFQFPALASFRMTPCGCRVSPFGHLRIIVCLPTPRSLSQAPTSFIASYCQGILRVPFVAFPPNYWRSLSIRFREIDIASTIIHIRNFKRPFGPRPKESGGERSRTDDLLRAKQLLSQLSYTPETLASSEEL